jgi:hypothetical protein
MAVNNRIFYAAQQVGIRPDGSTAAYTAVHGAQSLGITTTFNLEQVFELGQIEIYENIENTPDIEVTCEKVLDGYPPIYLLATDTASAPTLAGRSTARPQVAVSIFADTSDSASGEPGAQVNMSGMYLQNISYTIPVDGSMTESVSFVGNHKLWIVDGNYGATNNKFSGAFTTNADTPVAVSGSGGVQRRENLLFDYSDPYASRDSNGCVIAASGTILPTQVFGISSSGTNDLTNDVRARVQSISVSVDLGREPIFELGRRLPYTRFATFPVEVTSAIEVIGISGDMISATEEGIYDSGSTGCNSGSNLTNNTIKIATCDGTRINLKYNNKLTSSSQSGGDAGGGNVSVTYNFSNFNAMTVTHFNDPNATLGATSAAWLNWYMFDQATALP